MLQPREGWNSGVWLTLICGRCNKSCCRWKVSFWHGKNTLEPKVFVVLDFANLRLAIEWSPRQHEAIDGTEFNSVKKRVAVLPRSTVLGFPVPRFTVNGKICRYTMLRGHRTVFIFYLSQAEITSPSTTDLELIIVFNRGPKKGHLGQ